MSQVMHFGHSQQPNGEQEFEEIGISRINPQGLAIVEGLEDRYRGRRCFGEGAPPLVADCHGQ
ncbi:MAG: hypothetical protein KIT43_02925 [Bauldia sp.]|nr:hypothetical protein [Bauldia sp.]MCW5719342.1 hypothetical protein [Bauldia sp.]